MKRITLYLFVIVSLFLVACAGNDSDDTNQTKNGFKFGTSDASVIWNETVNIPVLGNVDASEWKDSVDNSFHVRTFKEKGKLRVYALHVGKCKVYIMHNGIKDSCDITITPKYSGIGNIYDVIGVSQNELIKTKKGAYTVSSTDSVKILTYTYKLSTGDYEEKYYIDRNDKVSNIISDIAFSTTDGYNLLFASMYERYNYFTTDQMVNWFKNGNGLSVKMDVIDKYHFRITY